MNSYLYDNWMTDYRMLETDFQGIGMARAELKGWNDAKVRRVERYLERIAKLSRAHKWAKEIEDRLSRLFIQRLTPGERLAVDILRLAANGAAVIVDPNDVAEVSQHIRYKDQCTRLAVLQSRQRGNQDFHKKFSGGRKKGSISDAKKHIFKLAEDNRTSSAKELFANADTVIIGIMNQRTFENHVREARKKYPKQKQATK